MTNMTSNLISDKNIIGIVLVGEFMQREVKLNSMVDQN